MRPQTALPMMLASKEACCIQVHLRVFGLKNVRTILKGYNRKRAMLSMNSTVNRLALRFIEQIKPVVGTQDTCSMFN